MRRLALMVGSDFPRREVDWQHIADSIKAQWITLKREPFRGHVAVGYEWRTATKPAWKKHMKIWPRVVGLAGPMLAGDPHPGYCRFIDSDEPRLTLTVEAP